ncbi:MAG: S1 RNA-binding domain-containing protein, partial [Lachnospiraceae bacterium]|nr:S1 RNA-binding domain-containing protein [Lachnospiraceae bacterium]
VGSEMQVKVKKLNDGEGQVVLTVRELNQSLANDKLKVLYENGEKLKGRVILINKGGLSIEVEPGVTVFMPASLVSNVRENDLNKYLNQELEFYITEFNPAKNRCIADRKKILVAEEKAKREAVLSKIHEGDVVEGTIKSILDYGVFVDIGGVDGLLHITEMGWGKIKNPKKTFNIGDKIRVLIREIKDQKISLTCKFPDENPWLRAKVNYAIGKTVKGTVARMTEYGAFIALDEDIDALLHVSEIDRKRVKKPEDVLKIGQEIEAMVIDFNEAEHRISLSMKALLPEEEKVEETEGAVDVNIEEYAKKMAENEDQ